MDHRPFSEPPRWALDHADLMVELEGWSDPIDDYGRFAGAHMVRIEERDGVWWVACTDGCRFARIVEAPDRAEAIRVGLAHNDSNAWVRTPEGELL